MSRADGKFPIITINGKTISLHEAASISLAIDFTVRLYNDVIVPMQAEKSTPEEIKKGEDVHADLVCLRTYFPINETTGML